MRMCKLLNSNGFKKKLQVRSNLYPIKLLPLEYFLQKCIGALRSGHSLQTSAVSLHDGPLDHSVPPLLHIEGLQAQERQQCPQVLHAVLDGRA